MRFDGSTRRKKERLKAESRLRKNIQKSYSLMTMLASSYEGAVVANHLLIELSHPSKPYKALEFSRKVLQQTGQWTRSLLEDKEVLLDMEEATMSGEKGSLALMILEGLKVEMQEIVSLAEILKLQECEDYSEAEMIWIIAQWTRFVNVKKVYLDWGHQWGTITNDQYLIQSLSTFRPPTGQDLMHCDKILTQWNQGDNSSTYRATLQRLVPDIAFKARIQIHDINLFLHMFEEEPTFEQFDIHEAESWTTAQIGALKASFWRAHGFDASQVIAWEKAGIPDAPLAKTWHDRGISPEEAIQWIEHDIYPDMAERWKSARFTVKEAITYISKGMKVPPSAHMYN